MRVGSTIVILAIVALFTTGLRAPSLPAQGTAQDAEEQVTACRATAVPALFPARYGRSLESVRKAPLLATLSCYLLLSPTCSFYDAQATLVDELRNLPSLPRTSRGPPALT